MDEKYISLFLLLSIVVISVFSILSQDRTILKLIDNINTQNKMIYNLTVEIGRLERREMCSDSMSNDSVYVNGLAFGSKYYCVWTADRNETQIANTDTHEKCHILIAKDNEHFCGDELK
jgi:hypothetical protein